MSTVEQPPSAVSARPLRADARRNREKVLAAAKAAFAEVGEDTSLEAIARRAGVGIGTLYRHFPTRQALLEALYTEEVEGICRTAADVAELEPWEALSAWLHRLAGYIRTKRALADQLLEHIRQDAPLFRCSREALFDAGEPLLARAQAAGVVRADAQLGDIVQLVMGIAKLPADTPEQTEHLLGIALDGLRYRG